MAEATATTEAEKKEAELRGQEITETLDRFDALSSEKKDALRAQFLETLPVAGMKKSFEKNGERHTMHRASFVKFFDVQMRK